jgi:AraC-like DNA-binding protein
MSTGSLLARRDADPSARMTVPPEAREFTDGAQVGPLAAFRTTFTIAGRHEEPSLFVFFMPSPRLDYKITANRESIDMRSHDAPSVICKMPGMPSRGDRTGLCQPVIMAGVEAEYLRSLAGEVFGSSRLEVPFRSNFPADDLELDLGRFLSALPADDAERAATVECLVPLVSIGLLRSCLPELAAVPIQRIEHPGIEKARRLIEAEFRSSLSLRELAAAAGLGRSQFIALFKRRYGATPHDCLRRVRIEEAKRLLARGRGVTETAFDVGFSSLGGFEEAFARLVGVSPFEYRRIARN